VGNRAGNPAGVPTSAPALPDLDADLRCLVTISRRDTRDAQQRQVLARIDDGPVSTLMFGDAVTCEVQPGAHLLRANNTLFWKRLRFSIEPGEHLELKLINYAGRLSIGFLAILGVAPLYLKIECRSLV
jgi:hypothetical protein